MDYEAEGVRLKGTPKKTWSEVTEKIVRLDKYVKMTPVQLAIHMVDTLHTDAWQWLGAFFAHPQSSQHPNHQFLVSHVLPLHGLVLIKRLSNIKLK